MDNKHRLIINNNIEDLVDLTDNLESIIKILLEQKIINQYHASYITKIPEIKEKVMAFYQLIQGRGPLAFNALKRTLRSTGNLKAEDILDKNRVDCPLYEVPKAPVACLELRIKDLDLSDNDTDDDDSIKVKPTKQYQDVDMDHPPNGVYKMRSNPRGYALVINILTFTTPIHEKREGSEVDMKKIVSLFKKLNFDVEQYTDLTAEEMDSVISKFSAKVISANDVDSSVLFIMTHGHQHKDNEQWVELIAHDSLLVNTTNILEKFVTPSNSKERKPKMFFFQTCRKKRSGSSSRNRTYSDDAPQSEKKFFREIEDMIIVYSAIPGEYSKRDTLSGGWFVNHFCKIVAENAHRYDLESMLGMVDTELRDLSGGFYGSQTVQVVKQGSFKKIYFNPGL